MRRISRSLQTDRQPEQEFEEFEEKVMGEVSIAVELREGTGKKFNRKLRASGRAPAVLYGQASEPVSLSIDPTLLARRIKESHAGINTLFELEGGGSSVAGKTVMVKELQREPVRGWIIHADFYEFDQTKRIHVTVHVELVGEALGLIQGGVIEHTLREIEVLCLPDSIPDSLEADVSGLEIGMALHVSDVVLPSGVEIVTDRDHALVSLVAPRAEEEVEEVEEVVEGEEGAEAAAGEDAPADAEAEKSD
jgi:large subunit ribosomal protein L25